MAQGLPPLDRERVELYTAYYTIQVVLVIHILFKDKVFRGSQVLYERGGTLSVRHILTLRQ